MANLRDSNSSFWASAAALRHALLLAAKKACWTATRWMLAIAACASLAGAGQGQDNGSAVSEFRGNGAEITVTVKDGSGDPISSPAMVKVFRDGTIPSGQQATSRGRAIFVVKTLGDYTVVVAAPGCGEVRKDLSLEASGRFEVEVYVRRILGGAVTAVPGRPLLAPKAKEAVDKGLQALSADKLGDAEKYVSKAVKLAPGHPDVLYVQGVLNLKERHWPQAQSAFEKATQMDPNDAPAFAALGMAFCDEGNYDAAIPPLRKSLELDPAPGAWEARWTLARALYHSAQYDEALKMSQDALQGSDGKAPEIALLVAQSFTAVGRYEDAAQTLRGFVKEHGDRRDAATARRWLEQLAANGKIHAK